MTTPSLFINLPGPKGIEYLELLPSKEEYDVGIMYTCQGGALFTRLQGPNDTWVWDSFRVVVPKQSSEQVRGIPLEGSPFILTVDVIVDGGKIFPLEVFTSTIPYVSHKSPANQRVELNL
ncbi:MAG: hypothetical protein WA030_00175 [Candidatus Microsaccharimonas sp.]